MQKITNLNKLDEGDYVLYKYKHRPMCVFKVTYSNGNSFVRYNLDNILIDKEMDIFNWADVNAARHLYKLNNGEALAFLM